jgi:hypothetical protein
MFLPNSHSFLLVRSYTKNFGVGVKKATVVKTIKPGREIFSPKLHPSLLLMKETISKPVKSGEDKKDGKELFLPNSHSFLLTGVAISKPVIHLVKSKTTGVSVDAVLPRRTSINWNQSVIQGPKEPVKSLSPPSSSDSNGPTVDDKNKRAFLKAAGIAGASLVASLLLPKKADALILGSSPTTGVVGVKDASNVRINPATEETVSTLATEATVSTLAKETTVSQLLKTSDLTFDAGSLKVKAFSDSADATKSALVDADRHVQVDVLSSVLPASASTESTLQTIAFGGTKFAVRLATDSANSNLEYIGEAQPGTLTTAALWRIKRIDNTSGVVIQWADGNASFDNIWDSRESLSYS